jgi:hypothetical protein
MGLDSLLCLLQFVLIAGATIYWHISRKKRSQDVKSQEAMNGEKTGAAIRTGGEDGFSPPESERKGLHEFSQKEISDEKFYERLLLIAAGIGAGYGKTRILKALPGYSGDIHPRLSNMYEGIKQSLEQSSGWAKMRKQ